MRILGDNHINDVSYVDDTIMATRKAWMLLQTFGVEMTETLEIDETVIPYDEDGDEENGVKYDAYATDCVRFGEHFEYQAVLDQFPSFEGKVSPLIGFVALHVSRLDIHEEPEQEQQIVFRLETHEDGPGVFIGDYVNPVQTTSPDKIHELVSFLGGLEQL